MNFNHTISIEQYEAINYMCWSAAVFFSLCSLTILLFLLASVYQVSLLLLGYKNKEQKVVRYTKKDNAEMVDSSDLPIIKRNFL